MCFFSVSATQPAPPPITCRNTGSRGASPSSSSRKLRENRIRWDAREEPKGPGPNPGSAPGSLRAPPRPRHPGGRPGQSPHQPGCPAPSAATHHLQLAARSANSAQVKGLFGKTLHLYDESRKSSKLPSQDFCLQTRKNGVSHSFIRVRKVLVESPFLRHRPGCAMYMYRRY
eukprot:COSAG02_NODE_12517_length_1533_cov_24.968619_2_plen_172_part_00